MREAGAVGRSRREGLRIAVLMGGPSSEHDVSLDGGRNVVEALAGRRYRVRPVVISREGTWRIAPRPWKGAEGTFDPRRVDSWRALPGPLEALRALRSWGTDVVVPVLHGRFGEDGVLQACLTAAGLAFVGSGMVGSALANDKVRTKEILARHGIRVPDHEVLEASDLRRGRVETAKRLVARFGLPLVLKDPCGGSSLEVEIPEDERSVAAALSRLAPTAPRLLAEAYVRGREVTVGVLDDRERGEPVALPVVEIRPRRAKSFDYTEKYSPDGAEELCPAPLEPEVEAEARALGLAVHRVLGLRGLSRTDMILDEDGRLQVLEVNTLPGMTERGLVPLAARALGISFPALLEGLLRTASTGG